MTKYSARKLSKYKLSELKEIADGLGLSISGPKSQLINRIKMKSGEWTRKDDAEENRHIDELIEARILKGLRVNDLKAILSRLGGSVTGQKKDLQERLISQFGFYMTQPEEDEYYPSAGDKEVSEKDLRKFISVYYGTSEYRKRLKEKYGDYKDQINALVKEMYCDLEKACPDGQICNLHSKVCVDGDFYNKKKDSYSKSYKKYTIGKSIYLVANDAVKEFLDELEKRGIDSYIDDDGKETTIKKPEPKPEEKHEELRYEEKHLEVEVPAGMEFLADPDLPVRHEAAKHKHKDEDKHKDEHKHKDEDRHRDEEEVVTHKHKHKHKDEDEDEEEAEKHKHKDKEEAEKHKHKHKDEEEAEKHKHKDKEEAEKPKRKDEEKVKRKEEKRKEKDDEEEPKEESKPVEKPKKPKETTKSKRIISKLEKQLQDLEIDKDISDKKIRDAVRRCLGEDL